MPDGLVLAAGRGIGADTARTACGRSPGPPGAAARRAVGLPPGGRDESCHPAYGAPPGPDPGRLRRATRAFIFPAIGRARSTRFTSWPSGLARRRCALEDVQQVCAEQVPAQQAPAELTAFNSLPLLFLSGHLKRFGSPPCRVGASQVTGPPLHPQADRGDRRSDRRAGDGRGQPQDRPAAGSAGPAEGAAARPGAGHDPGEGGSVQRPGRRVARVRPGRRAAPPPSGGSPQGTGEDLLPLVRAERGRHQRHRRGTLGGRECSHAETRPGNDRYGKV